MSPQGDPAAIKVIRKVPGSDRELLFVDLAGIPNVVPIWDAGEIESGYVLVMPSADYSLRHRVDVAGGSLTAEEVVTVLTDVCSALECLSPEIVHRDLKPENILLYQGQWCVCDFGIARFAAATTSPNTMKFSMTPAYAAPEQWRFERTTPATDVYAVGVVGFELLTGSPPFRGTDEELREQHLASQPTVSEDVPTKLADVILSCLLKDPGSRPSAANVKRRLSEALGASSGASEALAEANRLALEKIGASQSREARIRSEIERRGILFEDAVGSISRVIERLKAQILRHASVATVSEANG